MKKLLLLLLFVPLVSFGQSQEINGIIIDPPLGYKKIGDMKWKKGEDFIAIIENKTIVSNMSFKKYCEKESSDLVNIGFIPIDVKGTTHYVCSKIPSIGYGLMQSYSYIYKDGKSYAVLIGTNSDNFNEISKNKNELNMFINNALTNVSHIINEIL